MLSDIEVQERSMTGEGTFSADAAGGHMTFELDAEENTDILEYDVEVDVEPPPASKVVES
jgi:hypothetical protein